MKPFIKKSTKYSILFMRDDSTVSSFRLSSFWLKFFIFFFILVIILAAAGTYGTIYYHQRHTVVTAEREELDKSMKFYKVEAERLAAFSGLIAQDSQKVVSEPVRPQPGMVGSNTRPTVPAGSTVGSGPAQITGAELAASTSAKTLPAGAALAPSTAPISQTIHAATETASPVNQGATHAPGTLLPGVTQAVPAENSGASSQEQSADTPAQRIGTSEEKSITISKSKASTQGRSINVQFEMTNNYQGNQQSGQIKLYAITPNGAFPVVGKPSSSLKYSISHGKPVRVSFNLPKDITPESVRSVRLDFESNNNEKHSEEITLEH